LAALVLPVGPVAVGLLRFVIPYDTTDSAADLVRGALASPGAMSAVLWFGLVAALTFVPAVLWIGRLTRRHAPRLTGAALLLLVPGYLSMIWFIGTDLVLWSGAQAGLSADALVGVYGAAHPTSAITGGIFVVGHVLGTVLLGIAMWRSRTVPAWAAALTIVSQPLHFVAAVILTSPALDLVAWGLNAVGSPSRRSRSRARATTSGTCLPHRCKRLTGSRVGRQRSHLARVSRGRMFSRARARCARMDVPCCGRHSARRPDSSLDPRLAKHVMTKKAVILLAGPAGSGKTSTAARIARHPEWVHVSEDEYWVKIKEGRPPHERRTPEEHDIVQQRVAERVAEIVSSNKNVVLEFILYEDPPRPLVCYQEALGARDVPVITRILRPTVEEILRRIQVRQRRSDDDLHRLRVHAENQVRVLASPHIQPDWVIDTTDLTLEEVYARHFKPTVES